MRQKAGNHENKTGRRSGESLTRSVLFGVIAASMFMTGVYSLFLASESAGNVQAFTTDNLLRTAAPIDTDKIKTALGPLDKDFIFVILDTSMPGMDPSLEFSARSVARVIADLGLTSSVRFLYPGDNDFASIVEQNGIDRFPALLAVKKEGGIVRILNDYSEEYLQFAYHSVWGKTSDCSDDKSAVY